MVITDVASAGVNLHQANTLFLLDCPWSDSLLAQLVGRVWRIGQRRSVIVYTLVATNTLDPYIVHTRDGKRTFTTSLNDPIQPAPVSETAQPEEREPEERESEERESEERESRTTASRCAASQVSLTAIYLQR
jgi:SNF2 family DNA or RNA helicase